MKLSFRRRVGIAVGRAAVWHSKRSSSIRISDSTLRDGEQMSGATLEPREKVEIAAALEDAGVYSIEAGFPVSSRKDFEAIGLMGKRVKKSILTALCRTLHSDIDLAEEALDGRLPNKKGVNLFCGTSPVHRRDKLGKTKTQILELISDAVSYAAERFDIVSFGPEDATRTEMDFLYEVYRVAIDAGAITIGFPDTLGIFTPEKVRDALRKIQDGVPNFSKALMAVHFHNDLGLAVANSLAAIEEGVNIVQCTVNGIGERAGNASLEEVALALEIHGDQYGVSTGIDTSKLVPLCKLVSQKTGIGLAPHKPVAGRNIFSTEAGIHQDGLLKNPDSYLPFRPELVGADGIEIIIGRQSGRGAVSYRLGQLGYPLTNDQALFVLQAIKELPKEVEIDDQVLVRFAMKAMGREEVSSPSDL